MTEAWQLEERSGVLLARCAALDDLPGIAHAFSTRRADGRDDFDLGTAGEAPEEVRYRRRRFVEASGLGRARALILAQVHGAEIVRAHDAREGDEADGALWSAEDPGLAVPAVRTADCVPILLFDASGRAAAAVHAGWRGTAAGIGTRAVDALAGLGVAPGELKAALGPAIRPCCYRVGPEVVKRVAAACGGSTGLAEPTSEADRFRLDLHAANRRQLVRAGLKEAFVHSAPWCTACRGDLFFSYRREGASAGRLMAVAGPSAQRKRGQDSFRRRSET